MVKREQLHQWITNRAAQDDVLYQRYGQPLEAEHRGEFVAISSEGQVITGKDELALAQAALAQFGAGNFALRRIGMEAEIRWRRLR